MKITNKQLRQIIKEELQNVLDEADEFSPSQASPDEELAAEALTSDNKATVEDMLGRLQGLNLVPEMGIQGNTYGFYVKKSFYDAIINALKKEGRYVEDDVSPVISKGAQVTISEPYKKYYGDRVKLLQGYHAILNFEV